MREVLPLRDTCKLSVIICSYRRRERVLQAVRSCAAQTLPSDAFEVLVVNNDPPDDALATALNALRTSHFAGRVDRLRLMDCAQYGLSHARNAGIAQARGEVVCFLDDDAIAAPDWLEQIWSAFAAHPQLGVAGGPIDLHFPEPRPAALLPGLEGCWSAFSMNVSECTIVSEWWQFPWGCNWCACREALVKIGGFPTRYGRKGADFAGGEEVIAAVLIQRLGYTVALVPDARVTHDVEPERFTWRHVRRALVAGMLSRYRMERDGYLPVNLTIRTTLRELLRLGGKPDASVPPMAALRLSWYRVLSQCTLLRVQLRDRWERRWTPAHEHVAADSHDMQA